MLGTYSQVTSIQLVLPKTSCLSSITWKANLSKHCYTPDYLAGKSALDHVMECLLPFTRSVQIINHELVAVHSSRFATVPTQTQVGSQIMAGCSRFTIWLSSFPQYAFKQHRLHFWGTLIILIIFFVVMMACRVNLQWFWLLLYAALILPFAPYVTKPEFFYRSVALHCFSSTPAHTIETDSATRLSCLPVFQADFAVVHAFSLVSKPAILQTVEC